MYIRFFILCEVIITLFSQLGEILNNISVAHTVSHETVFRAWLWFHA